LLRLRIGRLTKSDCGSQLVRKKADGDAENPWQSVFCSPTWLARISKMALNLQIFRKVRAEILCSPDCVAERERFSDAVSVI